jgi:hypothetical protein
MIILSMKLIKFINGRGSPVTEARETNDVDAFVKHKVILTPKADKI